MMKLESFAMCYLRYLAVKPTSLDMEIEKTYDETPEPRNPSVFILKKRHTCCFLVS